MDLETENRLAALLMEEARRMRAEADREGVGVYLRQPNVRGRPNSRFLTATVLGVEQANRAVQVNEMWRAREKELELDAKLNGDRGHGDFRLKVSGSRRGETSRSLAFPSSSKRCHDDHSYHSSDEDGLRDDEVEEFLRSRTKRGRGAVGSRMDEPGPYPFSVSRVHGAEELSADPETREKEDWERRILGPEKPSINSHHHVCSKKKHHSSKAKRKKISREEEEKKKKRRHRHHKSRRSSDSE